MTAVEYMRAALDFQKRQRAVLAKLENLATHTAIARFGLDSLVPETALELAIAEHHAMVAAMFEHGRNFKPACQEVTTSL